MTICDQCGEAPVSTTIPLYRDRGLCDDCGQDASEAGYARTVEDFYESSAPQTDRERGECSRRANGGTHE